jgi:nucleoid-associated protein YgaU
MQQPQKGQLVVEWSGGNETIPFQYNPTELSFQKNVQVAEIAIPGLDTPLLQFVRGQNETLTVDLFFDTTESGMAGAVSVTTLTDKIYQLVKIEPSTHAPPICRFVWGPEFPGHEVSARVGNQKRDWFRCLVESVRHKYTLFSPSGVPLRATLTLTLREYKPLGDQLSQLGLNSPDRTQVRVLRSDETLSSIAAEHYRDPGQWRRIAAANGIEDPRRLTAGTYLRLPPLEGETA